MYLDNATSAQASLQSLYEYTNFISNNSFGNPHSDPKTQKIVDETRELILKFFNTNEYTVVFTSGATDSINRLGQYLDVSEFAYTAINHNSVVGLRNVFYEKGAIIKVLNKDFEVTNEWKKDLEINSTVGSKLKPTDNFKSYSLDEAENLKETGRFYLGDNYKNKLIAFPAECNFSGNLFDLNKISEYQNKGYLVLLDSAKYITSRILDLSTYQPDFIPVSWYKLFGHLTGIGCLLIKNSVIDSLKKDYHGGGSYDIMIPEINYSEIREGHKFEDGTPNFLSIIGLNLALKKHIYDNNAITITKYAFKELKKLRHYNNVNLVQIYGVDDINNHGSIIAFNLKDSHGEYIGFKGVERLCEQKNIKIRSGCTCNPGACNFYLNLTSEEVMENYKRGNKCWDTKSTSLNGKPTGAIRISFGNSSTIEDVNLFVKFLHDNYIVKSHENISFDNSLTPRITQLYIYPIKGALGFRVNNWPINKQGLKWDRHFAVYDSKDKSISLKSNVKLGLIRPEIYLEDGFMTLVNEETNDSISFYIKRFNIVQDSVNDWISNALGEEGCRLVECDDEKNFSNTSQYLLLNMNSLYDLNYRILLNTQLLLQWFPDSVKKLICSNYIRFGYGIGVDRFRPNIVVEGLPSYAEDNISEFTIGDITLKNDMDCVRCYTTTINSSRQQQDENLEPMRTLLKYRKKDGKVLFGTLFNKSESNDGDSLKEGEITFVNK